MCLWLRMGASSCVWENPDRIHRGCGYLPCLLTEMTKETFHTGRSGKEKKGNPEPCQRDSKCVHFVKTWAIWGSHGKNSQSRWKHCCALIGKVTGKHDRYLSRGMIGCWSWFLRQLVWWIVGTKERLAVVRPALKPGGGNSGYAGLRRGVCHWSCVHGSCAQQCLTLCDSVDVACQAPLSVAFLRQGYWSGLPCPPPRGLPDWEVEPMSPVFPALQGDSLPAEPLGFPK